MPKRCALGCPPSEVSTHVFPHPKRFPETFKAWVAIVGGKLETPDDYEYYRKKKICDIHFTENDRNRNNRLNCLAVPTLHLPNPVVQQNILVDQIRIHPSNENNQHLGHPTTSQDFSIDPVRHQSFEQIYICPSTNNSQYLGRPSASQNFSIASYNGRIQLEHNYSKCNKIDSDRIVGMCRYKRPMNVYERQLKSLTTQINRMRKQGKAYRSRLANAERINNEVAFKRVTENISTASKLFTHMQFTQNKKKPSGRRFTLEEKILSLSL